MGDRISKLRSHNIDDLVKETKLTSEEIKEWHKTFHRDHPEGYMTWKSFKNMRRDIDPKIGSETFSQRIFQMMDLNGDNRIDFREFIICFSVGSRGTFHEKAYWIFQLYKDDRNGTEVDGSHTGSQLSLEEFIELAKTHNIVLDILNSDMTKCEQ